MSRLPAAFLTALFAAALPSPHAAAATAGVPSAGLASSILVQLGQSSLRLPVAVDGDGLLRGAFSLISCDGSVREGIACDGSVMPDAALVVGVSGSIFPFLDGVVSFTDFGAPSPLSLSFSALIPQIDGLADTVLSGSVTVPAGRVSPVVTALAGGAFIESALGGPGGFATAATVGDGAITRDADNGATETYGPIIGQFDCAALGGCTTIALVMGVQGTGDGDTYQLAGRFDVDAAPAVVPLPASAALLLGGLAALGALGRRRAG